LATAAGLGIAGSADALTFELTGSTTYDWYGNGNVFQIQINTDTDSVSTISSTFVPNALGDGGDQTGMPIYGMTRDPATGKLFGSPDRSGGPTFDPSEMPRPAKLVEVHPQPAGTNWTFTNMGPIRFTGPGTSPTDSSRSGRGMTFTNDGSHLVVVVEHQDGTVINPPPGGSGSNGNPVPSASTFRRLLHIPASELDDGALSEPAGTVSGSTLINLQGYKGITTSNSRYQALAFNCHGDLFAITPTASLGGGNFLETFLIQIDPVTGQELVNYGPIQGTGGFTDPNTGDVTIHGWARGLMFGPDGRLYTIFNPGNDGVAGSVGNSITPAKVGVLDLSNGPWVFSEGDPGVPMHLMSGDAAPIAIHNLMRGTARMLLADWDLNGVVQNTDIQSMLDALVDLPGYMAANSVSEAELIEIGDLNCDYQVTNADIQAMLDYLTGGGGLEEVQALSLEVFGDAHHLDAYVTAVPEPGTLTLAGLMGLGLLRWRRSA
jgi:hypothetical protein